MGGTNVSTEKKIDVLSIGDIVTDAFIKLADDQAWTYVDEHGRKVLAMEFGTKVPFDSAQVVQAVGNAANAAVAFARIGLNSGFVTNVGEDQEGRDMITALHKEKVDTRFVRINPDKKSNYHYVLRYGAERTILIKHEEYDYHWPSFKPAEIPRWIYFSSISEHAIPYHDYVADWLQEHPDVKLAFQPGTFQMAVGAERLKRLYGLTDVLILNREEAVTVGGGNHEDVHDLINKLHELGAKTVVVTDGPNGAYASDGVNRYRMPLYPDPAEPVDRTGAGDSFASTFVAALIKGYDLEGALQWAPINSMSVVQQVGAQAGLLTEKELEEYLRDSPEWYRPERF
ncbi:MAG TPA: carbohydrate kinase family protein [Candidatus Saccharimonadales bacterium]|nr:carbohydrate kinase family protein [Candidatus Saccharimonadales bacterium]